MRATEPKGRTSAIRANFTNGRPGGSVRGIQYSFLPILRLFYSLFTELFICTDLHSLMPVSSPMAI